jgi:hypothetical protein
MNNTKNMDEAGAKISGIIPFISRFSITVSITNSLTNKDRNEKLIAKRA